MKYIGTRELNREDIAELLKCGFYLEYCDTGRALLRVDVFVFKE